jgi:hypothetical protein
MFLLIVSRLFSVLAAAIFALNAVRFASAAACCAAWTAVLLEAAPVSFPGASF